MSQSEAPVLDLDLDENDKYNKFSDTFELIKYLGQGNFGTVIAAKHKFSKQEYAIKIIPKNLYESDKYEYGKKEIDILSQLDHPNIIKFIKKMETDTKILIMMEWAKGGDLFELLEERRHEGKPFSDEEAAIIMKGILNGLEYMHSKDIIHRDLKPENILLANKYDLSSVKIIDLGLADQYEYDFFKHKTAFTTNCGTKTYMAPEFWQRKKHSKPVDLWSCSIIMYQIIEQKHPLYESKDSTSEYVHKILQGNYSFTSKFSALDPMERFTAEEALTHPWITRKLNDEFPLSYSVRQKALEKSRAIFRVISAMYMMCKLQNKEIIDEDYISLINQNNTTHKHRESKKSHIEMLMNNLVKSFQKIKSKASRNPSRKNSDSSFLNESSTKGVNTDGYNPSSRDSKDKEAKSPTEPFSGSNINSIDSNSPILSPVYPKIVEFTTNNPLKILRSSPVKDFSDKFSNDSSSHRGSPLLRPSLNSNYSSVLKLEPIKLTEPMILKVNKPKQSRLFERKGSVEPARSKILPSRSNINIREDSPEKSYRHFDSNVAFLTKRGSFSENKINDSSHGFRPRNTAYQARFIEKIVPTAHIMNTESNDKEETENELYKNMRLELDELEQYIEIISVEKQKYRRHISPPKNSVRKSVSLPKLNLRAGL